MNKLTISNLILLILNEENTSILRNEALRELKIRAYDYGLNYNDLICYDEYCIEKRGFNTKNYLFSKDVNVQKLLNTYFESIYSNNDSLLLSEKELCNRFGEFFDIITTKEMKNISKRLKDNNISIKDKQRLLKVSEILSERYNEKGTNFFASDDLSLILYLFNYSFKCDSTLKDKMFSNIEIIKRSFFNSHLDSDYIRYFHISNIIRQESKRLKEQKRNLLNQVKSGYEVDYFTPEIDNAIMKKIKK